MTQSGLFTRLLCTGAVGLFGLTAYAVEGQSTGASAQPASGTKASGISLGATAGRQAHATKLDQNELQKQAILAKYPNGGYAGGSHGGAGMRGTNDNCADAIAIIGEGVTPYSNVGATDDGPSNCGAMGSDIWYCYTASCTSLVSVTTCSDNRTYDTVLSVYDGCSCTGALLGCNDDGPPFCAVTGVPFSGSTVTFPATAGNSYLIQVGGFAAAQGSSDLTITCVAPPEPCADAQPGDVEEGEPSGGCAPEYSDQFNGGCNSSPPVFSALSCGQNFHGLSGTFLFGGANYRDTDWWLVTVASGDIMTLTVNCEFDSLIGFVDPNACAFIGTSYAFGTACTPASVTSACLPPGNYVCFVAPSGFDGVPCGVQYRGSLTCEPCTPPPPPANNNCADAIAIACGDTVNDDNIDATTDLAWPCAAGGSDVWYSFVATDPVVNLNLCGSAYDTSVAVVDGCGGPVLGCNDDACGLQSMLTVGSLTVGNTYLIAVGGFASQQGSFTMQVICGEIPPPPTCNEIQPGDIDEGEPSGGCATDYSDQFNGGCNSAPPVFSEINCGDNIHGVSGTFTFGGLNYRDTDWWLVTIGSGQIMTLTVNCDFDSLIGFVDPNACAFIGTSYAFGTACTPASVTSACLPPGDYVCFVAPSGFIGVPCGVQYRGSLTCEPCTPPPPPANDNCNTASAINCGETISGDNTNATSDGIPQSCSFGGAPTNSDVWYSFVADSASATVSTCAGGSIGDTVVSVYDGCGGAEIACNDDFCGLLSETTANGLTAGNTYYIRVAGWNATPQGTFSLTLSNCGATGACCVGGDCSVMSPSACASAGGSYQGNGTDCGSQSYSEASCSDTIVDISGTGTLAATASGCDDCGETVALPFSFTFFGNSYNTIAITSNGYLTFGGVLGDFSNDPIPSTLTPNDLIAPLWDDFHTGNFGDIFYQTLAGPSRFVVMWNEVARFGNAGSRNTFEAILYADGSIDYRYGAIDLPNLSASVGIENIDGTVGLALASPDGGTTCRSIDVTSSGDPCGCACPGDMDGSGSVDITDLALFLSSFGTSAPNIPTPCADIDGSGSVDITDLALFLSSFGTTCP